MGSVSARAMWSIDDARATFRRSGASFRARFSTERDVIAALSLRHALPVYQEFHG
jgi:hypothetical protein